MPTKHKYNFFDRRGKYLGQIEAENKGEAWSLARIMWGSRAADCVKAGWSRA